MLKIQIVQKVQVTCCQCNTEIYPISPVTLDMFSFQFISLTTLFTLLFNKKQRYMQSMRSAYPSGAFLTHSALDVYIVACSAYNLPYISHYHTKYISFPSNFHIFMWVYHTKCTKYILTKTIHTYMYSVDSRAFDALYYVIVLFAKQWKTGIQSQTLFSFF